MISGHTFGMYALAPVSGRLTDRFGSPTVIATGLTVTAAASILAAVAPPDGGVLLFLALFLLGYGWNLGFVAGSTLLSHGVDVAERTRAPGRRRRADLEHAARSPASARGSSSRMRATRRWASWARRSS